MIKKLLPFIFVLVLTPLRIYAFDATYYADAFEGGTTAYGNTFAQTNHSAAICYEELGQLTYVSSAQTGMVVTIDDRPNCTRSANMIDLSSSAFSVFAPLSVGRISDVSAVPLGIKTGNFIKRNLSQKEFSALGIELSKPIANTYFSGETTRLQGKVIHDEKQILVYYKNITTGEKYTDVFPTDASGRFDFDITFPNISGEYYFVIAAGTSFSTNTPLHIFIIDKTNFLEKISTSTGTQESLKQINILSKKNYTPSFFSLPKDTWGELTLSQGFRKFITSGQSFSFSGMLFSPGSVKYSFTGYTLSSASSLDRSPSPSYTASGVVFIDRIRETTEYGTVFIRKFPRNILFSFRLNSKYKVKPEYYVTLPNGDTREYSINRQYIDTDGFLKSGILIRGSFPITDKGIYRFELVQSTGIAYLNKPIYTEPTLEIIEKNYTLGTGTTYEKTILNSMNDIRSSLGRSTLVLDASLTTLANKKAEDMYLNKSGNDMGVSHVTTQGGDIGTLAQQYGIKRSVLGENVAGSNFSNNTAILDLQDGLEESPGHRSNIVSPLFTRVGIGYLQKNGYTYVVHVFSE